MGKRLRWCETRVRMGISPWTRETNLAEVFYIFFYPFSLSFQRTCGMTPVIFYWKQGSAWALVRSSSVYVQSMPRPSCANTRNRQCSLCHIQTQTGFKKTLIRFMDSPFGGQREFNLRLWAPEAPDLLLKAPLKHHTLNTVGQLLSVNKCSHCVIYFRLHTPQCWLYIHLRNSSLYLSCLSFVFISVYTENL